MFFAVDGGEGAGKSTLTIQMALYCDSTFDVSRIVFTPNEFRKAVIGASKFQAIVYDEAYTGLSSRSAMSMINRNLVSMLAETRQKNLFLFVVMPCFFDLDKYAALWRSRALIHVYTGNDFERGYFAFYNVDKKKLLYIMGKKFYDYSKPTPNFYGRFNGEMVIDDKEYRNKKKQSLTDRENKREEQARQKEIEDMLFQKVMEAENMPHAMKIKLLNMPESTYYFKLRQYNEGKI